MLRKRQSIICGDIIGNKLGQLKLENIISRAIFLAAKSYYLELVDGSVIVKIKGLNSSVVKKLTDVDVLNFNSFKDILVKDSTNIVSQNKSLKNLLDGSLDIIEQSYTIQHNGNVAQALEYYLW